MNPQVSQAKEPSPAREPAINDQLKGVAPATNVDKLSTASRLVVRMTKTSNFHDLSRGQGHAKETKEKASTSMIDLHLEASLSRWD